MLRTTFTSVRFSGLSRGARTLHSTPVAYKTVTEKVSEVADKVNKKVGQGLASAIEKGEKVTETTKAKASDISNITSEQADEAKQKASGASDFAGQKANQAAANAREAKDDFKKEVKK